MKFLPGTMLSSATGRPRVSFYIWAVVFIICIAALYHQNDTIARKIIPQTDITKSARNNTLGFQKIFVVNLPERTDRRDAMVLASSYTGFDVTLSPGVKSEEISENAIPVKWDVNATVDGPGALGAWRSHMNVMERIVEEKIQTALILEDDIDWDVSLKTQLQELAQGMRQLQTTSTSSKSPYGDSWDFLWLGHCRAGPHDFIRDYYIVANDPTVVPIRHRHSRWRSGLVFDPVTTEQNRVAFKLYAGMCLFAYAVTYEGARKALGGMSWSSPNTPVDVSYSAMCRQKLVQPFNCYGVYPPLFSHHRFAGPTSHDSDQRTSQDAWHKEYSWDVVYSAMLNIPRLISGAPTVVAQWPEEVATPEISRDGRTPLMGELRTFDDSAFERKIIANINDVLEKGD